MHRWNHPRVPTEPCHPELDLRLGFILGVVVDVLIFVVLREEDVLTIKGPLRDGLDLDLKARVQRIDLFGEVKIDHVPVVEAEVGGDGIEGDLEATIEITA